MEQIASISKRILAAALVATLVLPYVHCHDVHADDSGGYHLHTLGQHVGFHEHSHDDGERLFAYGRADHHGEKAVSHPHPVDSEQFCSWLTLHFPEVMDGSDQQHSPHGDEPPCRHVAVGWLSPTALAHVHEMCCFVVEDRAHVVPLNDGEISFIAEAQSVPLRLSSLAGIIALPPPRLSFRTFVHHSTNSSPPYM